MTEETGTLKELNVQPGDVVTPVDTYHSGMVTMGRNYTINVDGQFPIDGGGFIYSKNMAHQFRIISRASDTLKTWGEMTAEEKGALLLAHHEGKTIEFIGDGHWVPLEWEFDWLGEHCYRIKPKRETVTLTGRVYADCQGIFFGFHDQFQTHNHRITFDMIDGEPDCASIKMEKI